MFFYNCGLERTFSCSLKYQLNGRVLRDRCGGLGVLFDLVESAEVREANDEAMTPVKYDARFRYRKEFERSRLGS